MSRKNPLTPERQREVGAAIVEARKGKTSWKELEKRYDLGRTWLWTLYRAALGGERCSVNISGIAGSAAAGEPSSPSP